MSRSRKPAQSHAGERQSATVKPNARRSHGAAKTISPLSRGGEIGPSRSLSIRSGIGRERLGDADHRVAGDQFLELLGAHAAGARRALGDDQVTGLSRAVPNLDAHVVWQL